MRDMEAGPMPNGPRHRHYVRWDLSLGRPVWAATTPRDRARQLRGLIRHVQPLLPSRARLINIDLGGEPAGRCAWCEEPLEGRSRRWHPPCKQAMGAAGGSTRYPNMNLYLIEAGPCMVCGGKERQHELDHAVALAVARARGPRAELRARDIANLRWLCRRCHVRKTGKDFGLLADLRRGFVQPVII